MTPAKPAPKPAPMPAIPANKESARAREATDDRSVRVGVTELTALEGDARIVVGLAGARGGPADSEQMCAYVVDGAPLAARLDWIDDKRAFLVRGGEGEERRTGVIFGEVRRQPDGTAVREIVLDGWRFDVTIEAERRAALRERSRRNAQTAGVAGRLEIRAIIPGRIVAVSVAPGDRVAAGEQLLVLEAMKMQNELRTPRDGTVTSVGVAVGAKVEVGDVLMVVE